jgi:hypothetical protein
VIATGLVVLIIAVVLINDSRRLLTHSFRLDLFMVLLSFIIECSGLVLAVPVWRGILARFGSQLSYREDLRIYCYSMLGVAIPGGIWPVIGRAALYERQGVASVRVATASVVEFILIGLAGLIVYGLAAGLLRTENIWQRPGMALATAILGLVLVQPPLFNRIIGWLLRRSRRTDEPPVSLRYTDLGRWLVLEGFVVVIGGVAVYVLLGSLVEAPPGVLLPVVQAWAAAAVAGNLFFWIPGTPVIRDGAMTLILAQALPASMAILFVLLVRVWTIISILMLAALIWLFLGRNLRPDLHDDLVHRQD